MRGNRLDSTQEPSGFRFENRGLVVRTCKLLHGLQRIEEVNDDEFRLVRSVIEKNVPAPVACAAASPSGTSVQPRQ